MHWVHQEKFRFFSSHDIIFFLFFHWTNFVFHIWKRSTSVVFSCFLFCDWIVSVIIGIGNFFFGQESKHTIIIIITIKVSLWPRVKFTFTTSTYIKTARPVTRAIFFNIKSKEQKIKLKKVKVESPEKKFHLYISDIFDQTKKEKQKQERLDLSPSNSTVMDGWSIQRSVHLTTGHYTLTLTFWSQSLWCWFATSKL